VVVSAASHFREVPAFRLPTDRARPGVNKTETKTKTKTKTKTRMTTDSARRMGVAALVAVVLLPPRECAAVLVLVVLLRRFWQDRGSETKKNHG